MPERREIKISAADRKAVRLRAAGAAAWKMKRSGLLRGQSQASKKKRRARPGDRFDEADD